MKLSTEREIELRIAKKWKDVFDEQFETVKLPATLFKGGKTVTREKSSKSIIAKYLAIDMARNLVELEAVRDLYEKSNKLVDALKGEIWQLKVAPLQKQCDKEYFKITEKFSDRTATPIFVLEHAPYVTPLRGDAPAFIYGKAMEFPTEVEAHNAMDNVIKVKNGETLTKVYSLVLKEEK